MTEKDYGADPLGDGRFRMVPSGDIVDRAERDRRRLPPKPYVNRPIFGMTWNELEQKLGGRIIDKPDEHE
jgi:hypothetical protein